ncbi:MAG TPA: hypothetical protein VGO11_08405 [Chthoniobacteraceae bacterium]|nr:hypothetical protein [Chthoniobacteraceae bacterium]
MRQLIVENPGPKPLALGEVLVDGRDWRAALQPPEAKTPLALFTAWTQARSHAASGTKAAQNPWQMLRFWGYTLCGEDTKGLGALLAERGIAGRSVPLNGHVAGEYNIDGRWSVLDGDQNIAYLNLDNTTLASYAEIRADPFLALRTKPFGRFAQPSLAASQFNAGLFEYIEPGTSKPFKYKPGQEAAAPAALTLYPGERLIYHFNGSVNTQVGDPNGPAWKIAAPSALRLIELQAVPKARGWKPGALEVQTNYPILAAQNLETDAWVNVASNEPVFSCAVPVADELTRVSVWMQRSQVSFPAFHAGMNRVTVQADAAAGATVRFIYEAENLPARPAPPVISAPLTLSRNTGLPKFVVHTEPECDRLWWQIARVPDFSFIPPRLDQIEKTSDFIQLDSLAGTFLDPYAFHYLRMKTVRQGVWSDWSEPYRFRIVKFAAPSNLVATALPNGQVRLQWQGKGKEFAIFASNRLDFLPDLYIQEQITSMRGLNVQATRENQNRIATVKDNEFAFTPTGRYLRIIARSDEAWSNPSALFTLPDELCKNLPPAVVFQVRWTRDEKADPPDVYVGEERPLKP